MSLSYYNIPIQYVPTTRQYSLRPPLLFVGSYFPIHQKRIMQLPITLMLLLLLLLIRDIIISKLHFFWWNLDTLLGVRNPLPQMFVKSEHIIIIIIIIIIMNHHNNIIILSNTHTLLFFFTVKVHFFKQFTLSII